MPFPMERLLLDLLRNKNSDDSILSNDVSDSKHDFEFQYVSRIKFERIIEDVRRERTKKEKERNWPSFIREREAEGTDSGDPDFGHSGALKVNKLSHESLEEIDQKLKRLKLDTRPKQLRSTLNNDSVDRKISNRNKIIVGSIEKMMQPEDAVGSNNMLLMIPELIKGHSPCQISPLANVASCTQKHYSDNTLTSRSKPVNQSKPAKGNIEYNDSSGLSDRCKNSQKDDLLDMRLHPVVAHRILGLQKKISELLDEIEFRLNRIALPDGDRDLRRRQQRVTEFAIRFSRNYLYDLGRQISDIRRHVCVISSTDRVKHTQYGISLHMQAIEQKLTMAHQVLLHALKAYCKHVPSLVSKGQPGKLKEILQVIVGLKAICAKVHLTTNYFECSNAEPTPLGEDIEKQCSGILLKLTGDSDNQSRLFDCTTELSPIVGLCSKKRSHRTDNPRNLLTGLGMYLVDHRLSANLGSQRLALPHSRYRRLSSVVSQTPLKRPSTSKQENLSLAVCNSLREIGKRRKAKIHLPQREDKISTMMSTLSTDSDAASSVAVHGYESTKCSAAMAKRPLTYLDDLNVPVNAQLVRTDEQCSEKDDIRMDPHVPSLVPVIADLMTLVTNKSDVAIHAVPPNSMQALMEVLKTYRLPMIPDALLRKELNGDEDLPGRPTHFNDSRGLTKRSIGRRCGANNLRFICYTPRENACVMHDSVARKSRFKIANQAKCGSPKFIRMIENGNTTTFRMSETSLKHLLMYRSRYKSLSQSNPIYTSTSQNKPWGVVAWIADKLVDELIVDISEELQVKEALRKLFILEFKEF